MCFRTQKHDFFILEDVNICKLFRFSANDRCGSDNGDDKGNDSGDDATDSAGDDSGDDDTDDADDKDEYDKEGVNRGDGAWKSADEVLAFSKTILFCSF